MGATASRIRPPAVAGSFYPGETNALHDAVADMLTAASAGNFPSVKAIIVPHAGYIYSGPIAASGYVHLARDADRIRRIVLLGPSHSVPFRGLAAPEASAFATPLGPVAIDQEAINALADLPYVQRSDVAHAAEHSLEVQLPFLREVVPAAKLVPLTVGNASATEVAAVIERLWGGEETRFVISSDLSHYLPYAMAQQIDLATAQMIEQLDDAQLDGMRACGFQPISGLLTVARRHHLVITRLDLRNSGDTAGPRDRVVGYGSWALTA